MEDIECSKIAKLKKENLALKEKTKQLSIELQEIRNSQEQLFKESNHENFDERRVNLLKSQIIQLERQILLINQSISSRTESNLEVFNSLSNISKKCRAVLEEKNCGDMIMIPKSELLALISLAESARTRMSKPVQEVYDESRRSLDVMNKFVSPSLEGKVDILSICGGNTEHINLKKVSVLESRLVTVYKQLVKTNQALSMYISKRSDSSYFNIIPEASLKILQQHLYKSHDLLMHAASDLLQLSILTPVAPWPLKQNEFLNDIDTDRVISEFPKLGSSNLEKCREKVSVLMKAMNYKIHMAETKEKLYSKELSYHQQIYEIQNKYINNLFTALSQSCHEFNSEVSELLVSPIKEILEKYKKFELSSDESLKPLIKVLKIHSNKLKEAVKLFEISSSKSSQNDSAENVISEFESGYLTSLQHLRRNLENEREKEIAEIDFIKTDLKVQKNIMSETFPNPGPATNITAKRPESLPPMKKESSTFFREEIKEDLEYSEHSDFPVLKPFQRRKNPAYDHVKSKLDTTSPSSVRSKSSPVAKSVSSPESKQNAHCITKKIK